MNLKNIEKYIQINVMDDWYNEDNFGKKCLVGSLRLEIPLKGNKVNKITKLGWGTRISDKIVKEGSKALQELIEFIKKDMIEQLTEEIKLMIKGGWWEETDEQQIYYDVNGEEMYTFNDKKTSIWKTETTKTRYYIGDKKGIKFYKNKLIGLGCSFRGQDDDGKS